MKSGFSQQVYGNLIRHTYPLAIHVIADQNQPWSLLLQTQSWKWSSKSSQESSYCSCMLQKSCNTDAAIILILQKTNSDVDPPCVSLTILPMKLVFISITVSVNNIQKIYPHLCIQRRKHKALYSHVNSIHSLQIWWRDGKANSRNFLSFSVFILYNPVFLAAIIFQSILLTHLKQHLK